MSWEKVRKLEALAADPNNSHEAALAKNLANRLRAKLPPEIKPDVPRKFEVKPEPLCELTLSFQCSILRIKKIEQKILVVCNNTNGLRSFKITTTRKLVIANCVVQAIGNKFAVELLFLKIQVSVYGT